MDNTWLKRALEITAAFEGAHWDSVTGDFDGQGLSIGICQWNIGQGSLQSIIKVLAPQTVKKHMPQSGELLLQICSLPIRDALVKLQTATIVVSELKAFLSSPDGISMQLKACEAVGRRAYKMADKWRNDTGQIELTFLSFSWFFDLLIQSGGLKGLWLTNVTEYIQLQGGIGSTKQHILSEIASSKSSDSQINAHVWSESKYDDNLFVLSYLRAKQSRKQFQDDAMNRRGTLCVGKGSVHGKFFNLRG